MTPSSDRPDLGKVLDYYDIPHKDGSGNQQIHCPVHDDATPSCSLNLGQGVWNCFSCNKAGDGYTIVMEREGLTFAEASEFCQARDLGGDGKGVRKAPRPGPFVAGGKGYQPRYRRPVPARGGPRRPFS